MIYEVNTLKLTWMGPYREVVEQLIHYCNVYATVYKKELHYTKTDVSVSFAQIQVLEYLLENEELNQNMSTIAKRLGITLSTFSKLINVLVEKNLVEKYYIEGNKKSIIVHINDRGRVLYDEYSQIIRDTHFSRMFDALAEIPEQYLLLFAHALSYDPLEQRTQKLGEPQLIPVSECK